MPGSFCESSALRDKRLDHPALLLGEASELLALQRGRCFAHPSAELAEPGDLLRVLTHELIRDPGCRARLGQGLEAGGELAVPCRPGAFLGLRAGCHEFA